MDSLFSTYAGNDPVEEDVDIVGGDDPPVSSYPPVEILKDGTNRNSKCGSSSSSSSESGSSSSGSCLSMLLMCFLISGYGFIILVFAVRTFLFLGTFGLRLGIKENILKVFRS